MESGDFKNCSKWGARTDDLLAGGGQIADCFPSGGSDKKTLVNGEPPGDAPLNDGDTIELGRTVFRLRLID